LWNVLDFEVSIEEGWNVENITVHGNNVHIHGWGFLRQANAGRLVCIIDGGAMQRLSRAEIVNDQFMECAMPFYSQQVLVRVRDLVTGLSSATITIDRQALPELSSVTPTQLDIPVVGELDLP